MPDRPRVLPPPTRHQRLKHATAMGGWPGPVLVCDPPVVTPPWAQHAAAHWKFGSDQNIDTIFKHLCSRERWHSGG